MSCKKISELPISTKYRDSSAYIPAIVDGKNVRFSFEDALSGLGSGGSCTWKGVIENFVGSGVGITSSNAAILPQLNTATTEGSISIANSIGNELFLIQSNYSYTYTDSTTGSQSTVTGKGRVSIRMPSNKYNIVYNSSGTVDTVNSIVDEYKLLFEDSGLKIGTNNDLTSTFTGMRFFFNGRNPRAMVIGTPLWLEQGATQGYHAVRKDQVEQMIAAATGTASFDSHINDTTIHFTMDDALVEVKDNLLLKLSDYHYERDPSLKTNGNIKTVYLDSSKVKSGRLKKIGIRSATSSGNSRQVYIGVYQRNAEDTDWVWVGNSTGTAAFSASSPSTMRVWNFDSLQIAAGRTLAFVALQATGEPEDVSTAAQDMRVGTVDKEEGTVYVSASVLGSYANSYTACFTIDVVETANVYTKTEDFENHINSKASDDSYGHVKLSNNSGLKVENGEISVKVADNGETVYEDNKTNPVVINSSGNLSVPLISVPWPPIIITANKDPLPLIENNAVFSTEPNAYLTEFIPEKYLKKNPNMEGLCMFFLVLSINSGTKNGVDGFNLLINETSMDYMVSENIKSFFVEQESRKETLANGTLSNVTYSVYNFKGKQGIVFDCKHVNAGGVNNIFMNLVGTFP